jgi:hypothetical protein
LWQQDTELVHSLLDEVASSPNLVSVLPALHSAVGLDECGAERLTKAIETGSIPVSSFYCLTNMGDLSGQALKSLLLLIANQPDGHAVAVEILSMRFHSDRQSGKVHEPELLEAGRDLLRQVTFPVDLRRGDYELANIATAALAGTEGASITGDIGLRLRSAVGAYKAHAYDSAYLVRAMLEVQPLSFLGAVFAGDEEDREVGVRLFEDLGHHNRNPADAVPLVLLTQWCDEDPGVRYGLAAAIITYARRAEENSPLSWSEEAVALLTDAPDAGEVLRVIARRFLPMSWSGSRAAIIESNAELLDTLQARVPSLSAAVVEEVRTALRYEIDQERRAELKRDRDQDERFE